MNLDEANSILIVASNLDTANRKTDLKYSNRSANLWNAAEFAAKQPIREFTDKIIYIFESFNGALHRQGNPTWIKQEAKEFLFLSIIFLSYFSIEWLYNII